MGQINGQDKVGGRWKGLAINRIASDCDGPIGGARVNFAIVIGDSTIRGPPLDLQGRSTALITSRDLINKTVASGIFRFYKGFAPARQFRL